MAELEVAHEQFPEFTVPTAEELDGLGRRHNNAGQATMEEVETCVAEMRVHGPPVGFLKYFTHPLELDDVLTAQAEIDQSDADPLTQYVVKRGLVHRFMSSFDPDLRS